MTLCWEPSFMEYVEGTCLNTNSLRAPPVYKARVGYLVEPQSPNVIAVEIHATHRD